MIVLVLVVAAIVLGIVGVSASNMIQTIGFVGIGCLCGVLARLAQARQQHQELLALLQPPQTARDRAEAAAAALSPKATNPSAQPHRA